MLVTEGKGIKKPMVKNIALIIAHKGFQPVEYQKTRDVIENSGYQVTVASDQAGATTDGFGKPGPEVTLTVEQIKVTDYAGIFLIGGPGAMDHLNNEHVYKIMRAAKDAGILWGAICICPRILCSAGLLDDKKITGWDGDNQLKNYCAKRCPRAQIIGGSVAVDENLITAQGPEAAQLFGEAIVNALKQKHG